MPDTLKQDISFPSYLSSQKLSRLKASRSKRLKIFISWDHHTIITVNIRLLPVLVTCRIPNYFFFSASPFSRAFTSTTLMQPPTFYFFSASLFSWFCTLISIIVLLFCQSLLPVCYSKYMLGHLSTLLDITRTIMATVQIHKRQSEQ